MTGMKKNMTDYTKYLEDTVFCNDRSISSLNGWKPDGGSLAENLEFKEANILSDLTCSNSIDKFTVSKNIGNGTLKYPVGLLSRSEANLWGENVRDNGGYYWLGSPDGFVDVALGNSVDYGDLDLYSPVDSAFGVRPSISLKPSTKYTSGDGTVDSPFIIPTD